MIVVREFTPASRWCPDEGLRDGAFQPSAQTDLISFPMREWITVLLPPVFFIVPAKTTPFRWTDFHFSLKTVRSLVTG